MDKFWRTLGIALISMVLWAIMAAFFASKAQGQQDTTHFVPIPVILVDALPNGDIGTIACDTITNHPVVMVDRHTIGTKQFAETVTHEMTHVKQTYKGCKGALKEFALNPETRLEWEGEAYCNMYQTYYKGDELTAKLEALPSLLYFRHSLFPLTFASVKKRVETLCGLQVVAHSP